MHHALLFLVTIQDPQRCLHCMQNIKSHPYRQKKKKKKKTTSVWLLFYWHSRTRSDQTPMACSTTTVRTAMKVTCGLYLENNISYPPPYNFSQAAAVLTEKRILKASSNMTKTYKRKAIPHRFSYTDDRLLGMKSLRRHFHPPTWAAICIVESVWHAA